MLHKAAFRVKAIPIKTTKAFFKELEQNLLSTYGIIKDTEEPNKLWEKEEKEVEALDITIFNFKIYYKAIVIKTAWCSHKNRNIVQSDTIEHRSKPTYLEPKDFQQRYKENTLEKRQPSH